MEVFHLVFPREKGMESMVSHPGQEHCYVLQGEVLFFVGDEQHRRDAKNLPLLAHRSIVPSRRIFRCSCSTP